MKRLKELTKEDYILYSVFVLATIFFLVQHAWDMNWDFAAYVSNAKYFFYGGDYFEVYRAPLISVILGPLIAFGKSGEFLYVLLVSVLFLVANIKLSDSLYKTYFKKHKIDPKMLRALFYVLSLNGFVLFFGTVVGTELLALSFFELFIAYFIVNKYSGHFLGLAILSRYNFLAFTPLLLINKSIKKIILNIAILLAIISPWLIFNYVRWGNFFTSVVDSYFLNVFSRSGRVEPFSLYDLLLSLNWLTPFVIVGLIVSLVFLFSKKKKERKELYVLILFMAILAMNIYDYASTPFKIERYLFNVSLPAAFFSTIAIIYLKEKFPKWKNVLFKIVLVAFAVSLVILFVAIYNNRTGDDMYIHAADKIKELNLENCYIRSPQWVPIYYYTENMYYLGSVEETLANNMAALIFKCCPTIDYDFGSEDLQKYNKIFENDEFVIIANPGYSADTCYPREGWDNPMTSQTCQFISSQFPVMNTTIEKTCLAFNKQ